MTIRVVVCDIIDKKANSQSRGRTDGSKDPVSSRWSCSVSPHDGDSTATLRRRQELHGDAYSRPRGVATTAPAGGELKGGESR